MRDTMAVAIAAIVIGGLVTMVSILVKAYLRKAEIKAGTSIGSSDVEARLARIEQSIEAVALEVERISEGQRFTTKLLSESHREGGSR